MGALSSQEIVLALTPGQVAQVVEAATFGGQRSALSSLEDPQQLLASSLLEDPTVAKSLLLGLAVLVSFPPDGAERANKDVAQELGVANSTTHRYIHTLVAAGLLEQNPVTRRYRRTWLSSSSRERRRG
jgi:DNA-binding MarR family transcriptional regulator